MRKNVNCIVPVTLSHTEILSEKRIAEQAISKILQDLQEQTSIVVHGVTLIKIISPDSKKINVSLNVSL